MEDLTQIRFEELISIQPFDALTRNFLSESIIDIVDSDFEINEQNFVNSYSEPIQGDKISPFSGLSCLTYGLLYEHGIQGNRNLQKALGFYKLGVHYFLDSLCAYRLAEIYSQKKSSKIFSVEISKATAFCYLVISTLIVFQYKVKDIKPLQIARAIIKEFDQGYKQTPQILMNFLESLPETSTIKQCRQFIVRLCSYTVQKFTQSDQQDYNEIIHHFIKALQIENNLPCQSLIFNQLIFLVINHQKVNDKLVSSIIECLDEYKYLEAIMISLNNCQCSNLILGHLSQGEEIDLIFENQREFLFELTFIVKDIFLIRLNPNKINIYSETTRQKPQLCYSIWSQFRKIYAYLLSAKDRISKDIHKTLIIRNFAEIVSKGIFYSTNEIPSINPELKNGLDIELQGLQVHKSSHNLYANTYYNLAVLYKKLGQNVQFEDYIEKSERSFQKRLDDTSTDPYQALICNYYMAKISRIKQNKAMIENYLQNAKDISSLGEGLGLKHVRTTQYHILLRKIKAKLQRLQDEKQQLKQNVIEMPQEEIILMVNQNELQNVGNENIEPDEEAEQIEIYNRRVQEATAFKSKNQTNFVPRYCYFSGLEQKGPYIQNIFHLSANDIQNQQEVGNLQNITPFDPKQKDLADSFTKITSRVLFANGLGNTVNYLIYINDIRHIAKCFHTVPNKRVEALKQHYLSLIGVKNQHIRNPVGVVQQEINEACSDIYVLYRYNLHNLYSFVKEKQIGLLDKVDVALSIVNGLQFLQSMDIVLGNFKPNNVIISYDNQTHQFLANISDWETSINYSNLFNRNQSDIIKYYAAEEIYKNLSTPNPNSDTWSLGIIFLLLFFFIDLGVEKHWDTNLKGKQQVDEFSLQDIYQLEQIEYEPKSLEEGVYDANEIRFLPEISKLISRMTKRVPEQRSKLNEIQKQLEQLRGDIQQSL